MDVSENGGFPPKSSILIRVFHYFHHPFWGKLPFFWKGPASWIFLCEGVAFMRPLWDGKVGLQGHMESFRSNRK